MKPNPVPDLTKSHRSPVNLLVHIISTLISYSKQSKKSFICSSFSRLRFSVCNFFLPWIVVYLQSRITLLKSNNEGNASFSNLDRCMCLWKILSRLGTEQFVFNNPKKKKTYGVSLSAVSFKSTAVDPDKSSSL